MRTADILNTHAHREMHTFVLDGVYGKYGIWMKKLYGMRLYPKSESKCTLVSHILIQDRLLIQSISFLHTVSKHIIFAMSLSLNQCSPIQCLLFHEWCFQNAIRLSIGIRFWVNSFSRSNTQCGTIWRQSSRSALAQVMACCLIAGLVAPSHYHNQYWYIISKDLWQLPDQNFTRETPAINR